MKAFWKVLSMIKGYRYYSFKLWEDQQGNELIEETMSYLLNITELKNFLPLKDFIFG